MTPQSFLGAGWVSLTVVSPCAGCYLVECELVSKVYEHDELSLFFVFFHSHGVLASHLTPLLRRTPQHSPKKAKS